MKKMMRLQKELDIVRERAAERMEAKLNKSTWRKLTDPLRRHSHSWINVGAVLLAYILAHNLYMSGKEKRQLQQELDEATTKRDLYQQALRELVQETTVKELSKQCWNQISSATPSSSSSWWNRSSKTTMVQGDEQQPKEEIVLLQQILQKELQERIGDHILTDEERRIKEMQKAWEESQQQIVILSSPEQELVHAVLGGDSDVAKDLLAEGTSRKQQRRVISM
jgi:hypothetical protein